jgi:hypothetical protein
MDPKFAQVIQVLKNTQLSYVLENKDLFTYILSFLTKKELKAIFFFDSKLNIHAFLYPRVNTLLYGQVQSGKTGRILDYIKNHKTSTLKILIVQNSRCMLNQYVEAFAKNDITFVIVDGKHVDYSNQQVLITIFNQNRMTHLHHYMQLNNFDASFDYSLILDESDQYFTALKTEPLFLNAKDVLHVTATPFRFAKEMVHTKPHNEIDNTIDHVIDLKPSDNYYGLNEVDITEIKHFRPFAWSQEPGDLKRWKSGMYDKIDAIMRTDFLLKQSGFLLISVFNQRSTMRWCGAKLSRRFPGLTVLVACTESFIIVNNQQTSVSITNMRTFIDGFNDKKHLVILANRMANRGVNYTNIDYTRHLTHQIAAIGTNTTSFMQKCRIFGNRPADLMVKPKLYVVITDGNNSNPVPTLKETVTKLVDTIQNPMKQTKLKVKELKAMCKANKLKGYTRTDKQGLINMLLNAGLLA